MTAEEIAERMATVGGSREIQIRQTRFRQALVAAWGVEPGERILEIGCGQGDTTAALAAAEASVLAIDPADPSYGAPFTLGKATRHLSESDLGRRIEFRLGFDPLTAAFPDDAFDAVVLAHCSWYFPSIEVLRATLTRASPWARRLLFSEWDLTPTPDAVGHLLAVVVQGQVEAYKPVSESNVRTPLTRARLTGLVEEAGWRIVREESLDSSGLDDGRWEVGACLAASAQEAASFGLPPRLRESVEMQVEVLRALQAKGATRSLSSYALVAERT